MTRKSASTKRSTAKLAAGRWRLQDAKARFSEVVRLAQSVGPQRVTLHGRDTVVIVGVSEFDRLSGGRTGQDLIDVLRTSPHREIDIAPARAAMPVRAVRL